MNDRAEVAYAHELLQGVLSSRSDRVSEVLGEHLDLDWVRELQSLTYLASASRRPDLLTQWRNYAPRRGFTVGLDMSRRLAPLATRTTSGQGPLDPSSPPRGAGWFPVVYDEEAQSRMLAEVLDFVEENGLIQDSSAVSSVHARLIFGMLLPQFKHPSFADEREVRFITRRQEWMHVGQHRRGSSAVAHLELRATASGEFEGTLGSDALLPIVEVMAGPRHRDDPRDPQAHARSTLTENGYDPRAIEISATASTFEPELHADDAGPVPVSGLLAP